MEVCLYFRSSVDIDIFRLTGILCVVNPGSTAQIIIAVALMMLFIKLYSNYSPYVETSISALKSFTQWQIYAVYFIALLLKLEAFKSSEMEAVLEISLILALLANLLVELLQRIISLGSNQFNMKINQREIDDSMTDNPMRSTELSLKRINHISQDDSCPEEGIRMSSMIAKVL